MIGYKMLSNITFVRPVLGTNKKAPFWGAFLLRCEKRPHPLNRFHVFVESGGLEEDGVGESDDFAGRFEALIA